MATTTLFTPLLPLESSIMIKSAKHCLCNISQDVNYCSRYQAMCLDFVPIRVSYQVYLLNYKGNKLIFCPCGVEVGDRGCVALVCRSLGASYKN